MSRTVSISLSLSPHDHCSLTVASPVSCRVSFSLSSSFLNLAPVTRERDGWPCQVEWASTSHPPSPSPAQTLSVCVCLPHLPRL